jgi:hypothetical protein
VQNFAHGTVPNIAESSLFGKKVWTPICIDDVGTKRAGRILGEGGHSFDLDPDLEESRCRLTE